MPSTEVFREPCPPIPGRRIAHVRTEGLAAVGMEVVVAGDREPDAILHAAPRSTEALLELLHGPVLVGRVAEGGHDAGEAGRQGTGGIVGGGVAHPDVPGGDQGDGRVTRLARDGMPGRGRRRDRGPIPVRRWRRSAPAALVRQTVCHLDSRQRSSPGRRRSSPADAPSQRNRDRATARPVPSGAGLASRDPGSRAPHGACPEA